jgi:stage II sporulation protein D
LVKMKAISAWSILLLWSFVAVSRGTEPPILSVGILEAAQAVFVSAQHGFRVYKTQGSRKVIFTRWNSSALKFEPTSRGFGFLKFHHLNTVDIDPFKGGLVYVNGKGYRGKLTLFEDKFGKITVVNRVDLESYLFGVIKSEMLINSPFEALKAQAVVARTYAIKNQKKFLTDFGFGLSADVRSQVYNGIENEHEIARKVVKETRGRIVTSRKEPISAFYHSACGGSTLASKDWHGKSILYLKSIPCPYCQPYKNYDWELELSYDSIKNKLREAGKKIRKIESIDFNRTSSGRLQEVSIKHPRGVLRYSGTKFRALISPSVLRSTMVGAVEMNLASGYARGDRAEMAILSIIHGRMRKFRAVRLRGTGFGHGVGLCQWGAKGLAKKGYSFQEILKYYYSGVSITQMYP